MAPLDNFDDKFKAAATHDEQQPLPSLDRIWERVEAKMDHKALKTENRMWKKWAIAASVLLVATVGYQIFQADQATNESVATPEVQIRQQIPPTVMAEEAMTETVSSSSITPQAERILEEQLQTPVAVSDVAIPSTAADEVVEPPTAMPAQKQLSPIREESGEFEYNPIPARGVKRVTLKAKSDELAKEEPLYVLDGKVSNKAETEAADVETVVKLDEPLYIINGKEYSEKEMFGPNPTSPYAPLAEQDIESISILQGKEATDAYGSKGRKGVVIVKTKNGKPKPKAK